jgi:DNA-binding GntR family transcriptional regulator
MTEQAIRAPRPRSGPRPESRAPATYETILELIVQGELAPGSRLIETDLVERLGVERRAVRSMLQRLEHEGLVARLEGGRARWVVSPLTLRDFSELMEIMAELEGLAARRAARLPLPQRRRLAEKLRSINARLRKAASGASPRDTVRAVEQASLFHCHLVEGAGGTRLLAICESLKPQAARYAHAYTAYYIVTSFSLSANEHDAVIDAIERGDADGAERGIRRSLAKGSERLARVMVTVGEKGIW